MTENLLSPHRRHLPWVLGLLVLAVAVFGRTLTFDFLSNWDDYQYITGNPDIRGLTLRNLGRIFSSVYVGNYAPLHLFSYLLDYQVAGMNPGWFHFVNVLFHAANGVLLYLLVHRLTGKPVWAFASAAVFLLHPAQVESVAWVTERKNLLAMFFSLASFHFYAGYREGGDGRRGAYALSLLSLVLALLAKSVAVVVPLAFLLQDLLVEKRNGRELWYDKIPFFLAVAAASAVTLYTQSTELGGGRIDFFDGDLRAKLLTMLPVLTAYLRILLWPAPDTLNSIYIFRIRTAIDGEVLLAAGIVLLLLVAGVWLWRRERLFLFGFLLFFLGLVPVSQIVPLATLMNDRYLYFPMLGAAWLAGGLLSRLHDAFPGKKAPAAAAALCLLLPLALFSWQRSGVWRNAVTLWSDVVRKLPDLRDPRAALAAAYLYDGRKAEALRTYEQVFALKREFTEPLAERKALLEAARLYLELGPAEKALPLIARITAQYPDYSPGHVTLGYYHLQKRNPAEAEKHYRTALSLDPKSLPALISLGNICLESGRVAEAKELYRKCLDNGGNGPDLQYNLACAEARLGNLSASLEHLEEALALGYRNIDGVRGNPELAPLRKIPRFHQLLDRYFPVGKGGAAP